MYELAIKKKPAGVALPIRPLRAVSNLSVPQQFRLSKQEKTANFMYFYSSKFAKSGKSGDDCVEFLYKLALQPFFPQTRVEKLFAPEAVKGKGRINIVNKLNLPQILDKAVLKREKVAGADGFTFESPLARFYGLDNEAGQLDLMQTLMGFSAKDNFTPATFASGFITTKTFLAMLKFPGATTIALSKALLGLDIKVTNGMVVISTRWFITRREAESMTSTAYLSIRPANLYVMLRMWVASYYGDTGKAPQSSMPVSMISGEVAKAAAKGELRPRNKADGIVAMEDGSFAWIPDIDQSAEYEQALHDYGFREDGSYSFDKGSPDGMGPQEHLVQHQGDEADKQAAKKLPANMPVFSDWVNMKFAYSNTMGMLDVLDLDRCVPLRAFHVREFLETKILSDEKNMNWMNLAIITATSLNPGLKTSPTPEELNWGQLVPENKDLPSEEYIERAINQIVTQKLDDNIRHRDDVKIKHLSKTSNLLSLRCIGRLLEGIDKLIRENIDNAYRRYSVMTIIETYAKLHMFAKYSPEQMFTKVVETDEKQRAVYLHQGVDPKHTPVGLPLIQKNMAFMPHQAKAENLMRGSPNFAVWSIAAGGGKTLLALTDILKEVVAASKRHETSRPLVICPAHLVADYVKEAVYLTEGRVNMIPLTTYSVRRNGFARLAKMVQMAPPNTVFVTDYNFVKGKAEKVSYGIKPIVIFKNVEFLRQFGFDMVICDESHFLKNVSSRSNAVHRLISEIPKKRLASGTLIKDTTTDIVAQMALLDPTVFGNKTKFINDYAQIVKGEKVLKWRDGAEAEMHKRMREHCVFVSGRRKEWASLLPNPTERFHGVEMTRPEGVPDANGVIDESTIGLQSTGYQSVLEYTIDLINKEMQKNKALKKAMDTAQDEEQSESLASLLKPYLSRLESYLAAPSRDILGKTILTTPNDKMSPKTKKIIEICRHHLGTAINASWEKDDKTKRQKDGSIFGKILIFTNHIAVAEDVYESLPSDLKKLCIHYTAGQKLENAAEFENNTHKRIMVGVGDSMNTGLNLQYVSRLIRIETPWTPGDVEQGNSRINRPQLKKNDLRLPKFGGSGIFFDTLVVNRSFDITKISRLVAKMIMNSKFDEPNNLAFQAIENVPIIPMTIGTVENPGTIMAMNDFQTSLAPYLQAYGDYTNLIHTDYAEYREANKDKMDPVEVPATGLLPGSKLMSRIPYVPNMAVYGTEQLGLVRYDEYMRQDIDYDEAEDEGGEDEEDNENENGEDEDEENELKEKTNAALEEERKKMIGLGAHTEFGDGTIEGVSKAIVRVRLSSGAVVRPRKMACFIITRTDTNSKDIRNQLLKLTGNLPIESPIDVPATDVKLGKGAAKKAGLPLPDKEPEAPTGLNVELSFELVNDFLAVVFKDMENKEAVSALASFGFRAAQPHYISELRNAQTLVKLMSMWKTKGFVIPSGALVRLRKFWTQLKSKGTGLKTFGLGTTLDLKNFYITENKPANDARQLKPYPVLRNNKFYVVLPAKAQMSSMKAVKLPVPGVKWILVRNDEMFRFVNDKNGVSAVMKAMLSAKIKITNLAQLKKDFMHLKVAKKSKFK